MDIKKSDSPLHSGPRTPVTKQPAESNNQTSQQPNQLDLKANFIGQIKVGQKLELLVIKLTNYDAILEVIGSKTQVRTSDKDLLQLGQRLKAQITSTDPIIQLKVINPNLNQDNKLQSLINSTLRQIMPMQQPIKNLLDNIQLLAKMNLPPDSPLQRIKESFIQSIPPSQAFEEADVLPEIFKRSGIYTEHLLQDIINEPNQNKNFPNNDLKIALLRLASKLRSLGSTNTRSETTPTDTTTKTSDKPIDTYSLNTLQQTKKTNTEGVYSKPSLLQMQANITKTNLPTAIYSQDQLIDKLLNQTEGVLSRLQTLQLQHFQPNDTQKPSWLFELPIRTDTSLDNIVIQIEQDESGSNNNAYTSPWKIILKFNIEELGEIHAHITLQGSNVSVNFWVDSKSTSKLFSEYLDTLDSRLNNVGLVSGKLKCHCDKPPHQPSAMKTQIISETS